MADAPPRPAPDMPATMPEGAGTPREPVVVARTYAQKLFDYVLNWPGGRWPVPTVTSLFVIAALIVAGVELLPNALSDVTSTVRARTEVLELTLQPGRTYVWWLPRGSYSLLTAPDAVGCEHRSRFDVACSYAEPTVVTINNGATARFELKTVEGAAAPSFMLALKPREATDRSKENPSTFEIRNGADELLVASRELVTFESLPVESWRIPLIVERVAIGESLSDSVAASDALGTTARQPILIEGEVRVFARALWFDERYQIKEERFDPADVVQMPADPAARGVLVGVLSLDAATQQRDFDLTLHTDLAEVFVRRLGGGHRIGVSMWAIMSNLPFWLALWVVWVSLIIVANYYSDRLGELRGHKNEGQKK
jgi:hypothetical protein